MSLFKSKATIADEHEAEMSAAKTLNLEIQSQLDTAKEESRVASESNASLREQLADETSENEGLAKLLASSTADLATANKSLAESEAKQDKFDEKVEAAALLKVGSAGHTAAIADADLGAEADEDLESAIKAMNNAKTGGERHTAALKVTALRKANK